MVSLNPAAAQGPPLQWSHRRRRTVPSRRTDGPFDRKGLSCPRSEWETRAPRRSASTTAKRAARFRRFLRLGPARDAEGPRCRGDLDRHREPAGRRRGAWGVRRDPGGAVREPAERAGQAQGRAGGAATRGDAGRPRGPGGRPVCGGGPRGRPARRWRRDADRALRGRRQGDGHRQLDSHGRPGSDRHGRSPRRRERVLVGVADRTARAHARRRRVGPDRRDVARARYSLVGRRPDRRRRSPVGSRDRLVEGRPAAFGRRRGQNRSLHRARRHGDLEHRVAGQRGGDSRTSRRRCDEWRRW